MACFFFPNRTYCVIHASIQLSSGLWLRVSTNNMTLKLHHKNKLFSADDHNLTGNGEGRWTLQKYFYCIITFTWITVLPLKRLSPFKMSHFFSRNKYNQVTQFAKRVNLSINWQETCRKGFAQTVHWRSCEADILTLNTQDSAPNTACNLEYSAIKTNWISVVNKNKVDFMLSE